MTPKFVDRDKKREHIALVALSHFSQKGFAVTSMSQVAKSAGIGKGTIYEYFKSKDALIRFAIELYIKMIEDQVGATLSAISNPRDRLRHYVLQVMDAFMNDPHTMGITLAIFQMLIVDQKEAGQTNVLCDMFHRSRQTIITIISEGVSQGIFQPTARQEAEVIAVNLTAYLDGIWLHYLINPGGIDLNAQVHGYLETLFHSMDHTPL